MMNIQDIKINYIYSFFIETYKDNRQVLLDWNGENKFDGKKISGLKSIFLTKLQSSENVCVEYHESEEYEPLNNRSALYYKFPHFSIKKDLYCNVSIQNLFSQDKIGNVFINAALFQTGMGIMWISISLNDMQNINIEDIYKLNQREKMPLFIISDQSKTPDNIFQESINNLIVSKLNEALLTYQPLVLVSKNGNELFWKDTKNNYNRGSNIYQEPSIAILLKSNNYDEINQNDFNTFVSSVLHGVPQNEIDSNHTNNYNNLYPTKNFYTQIHGNCLLTVHKSSDIVLDNISEEIQNYNEFKTFYHGLFRTYCAVRGTWHTYNLLNEKIDECLKDLSGDINDNINTIDEAKYTKQNILLKNLFFQYINSEDPFVRGIGLTPFATIYSESMNIYKSNEIRNNIRHKLKDHDKLIENIISYGYLKNSNTHKKNENKPWYWIKHVIYVIITLCCLSLNFFVNNTLINSISKVVGISLLIGYAIYWLTKKYFSTK